MGHPQIGTDFHQKLHESRVIGEKAGWPALDLIPKPGMEVFDRVAHLMRLANMRTAVYGTGYDTGEPGLSVDTPKPL